MTEFFTHAPEGDHNPYETVPWARTPLHPTDTDAVRIGVTTSSSCLNPTLHWSGPGGSGSIGLTATDDALCGEMGPFRDSVQYRFTATGPDGTKHESPWFPLPVTVWSPDDTAGVTTDGGVVVVSATDRGQGDIDLLPAFSAVVGRTDGHATHLRVSWELSDGEAVYGTGERFDSLDQRGRTPDVRVYEQYKGQGDRTYFPNPWLVSSAGYGVRVHSSDRTRFDIGAADPGRVEITVPVDEIELSLYRGSPADIVSDYSDDVGRPPRLPAWVFGPWMSGNEWDRESRVREVVGQTLDDGIPAAVLVIEAWSDETTFYVFNDTEFSGVDAAAPTDPATLTHAGKWPDPKGMVDWLHDNDIRLLLWQIPVLKDIAGSAQHEADVEHASANDFCVKVGDGADYRNRGWWFPNSRVIDFTNPDARKWWLDKRRYLVDHYGIDGFKTDGGEHLWGSDVNTHAGETGHVAGNRYPNHYLGAYHELLDDRTDEQLITFSRAGFEGSQRFPAHWAGDEDSTWDAYRASLVAGLSAAMSGVTFWTWDLAGFSGPLPSAELYKRGTQMAAFSPIMQYHSEHNDHRLPLHDRTPWNVAEQTQDAEVAEIYAFFARLRMNLIPYLYSTGAASVKGVPMMRPMVLMDPRLAHVDDQYMLGDSLLVAPILEEGATGREVVLPDGEWFDFWTAERVSPGTLNVAAPIDRLPVYVKGPGLLPMHFTDEIRLGARAGLPSEDGVHAVAVHPADGDATITDCLTGGEWTVATSVLGSELHIRVIDCPRPTVLWIRDVGGGDRTFTVSGNEEIVVPILEGDDG